MRICLFLPQTGALSNTVLLWVPEICQLRQHIHVKTHSGNQTWITQHQQPGLCAVNVVFTGQLLISKVIHMTTFHVEFFDFLLIKQLILMF